jgi:hypothetical protein
MAWVVRGARRYYYRSRRASGRVGRVGRVGREYFGAGAEARLAAALDEQRRAERQARRRALTADRECWHTAAEPSKALAAGTDLLLQAALLAAGYHRPNYGRWRRWRHDPDH